MVVMAVSLMQPPFQPRFARSLAAIAQRVRGAAAFAQSLQNASLHVAATTVSALH
jgi:hypothetical protein